MIVQRHYQYVIIIIANVTSMILNGSTGIVANAHNSIISFPLTTKKYESSNGLSPQENTKFGGRRLQSTAAHPIFQGYGAYYVNIYVGSPPQRQTVLVDTGSEKVGIPCKDCVDCGNDHTDPLFNQAVSHSFNYLKCDECYKGRCNVSDNTCDVRSEYVENSSWFGKEVQDSVHLGGYDVKDTSNDYQFPSLKFSCIKNVKGAFQDQLANGIMGLGVRKGSFWWQMYDQGHIKSKQFSICLDQHPISKSMIGRLALGGVDERLGHASSDMQFMDFTSSMGYYEVKIRNVHLSLPEQNQEVLHSRITYKKMTIDANDNVLNAGGVIIDSGTTGILLSPAIKDSFEKNWELLIGEPFPTEPIQISAEELKKWPTIMLQMKGSSSTESIFAINSSGALTSSNDESSNGFDKRFPDDVIVAIPASHYMTLDLVTKEYVPVLNFDGAHGDGR